MGCPCDILLDPLRLSPPNMDMYDHQVDTYSHYFVNKYGSPLLISPVNNTN